MQQNYTLQEVSDRWKCSLSKVRDMVRRGQLATWRIDGWSHRVTADEMRRHEHGNANETEQNAA